MRTQQRPEASILARKQEPVDDVVVLAQVITETPHDSTCEPRAQGCW